MKILRRILYFILALIAILLVIPLFVKNEFSVTREITVARAQKDVFEYVKYLKNHDNFNHWMQMDKNMKKTFTGTDGTRGFVYAWDSQMRQLGAGEEEIVKIIPGERIDYILRFLRPVKATNEAYMKVESEGADKAKVIWGFHGKMGYPFNAIFIVMKPEKAIGYALQDSLGKLKGLLEKK